MKANCPLLAARPAHASAPATLRVIDGHQGRVEPPRVRGDAFQFTTEEVRVVSYVFIGMFI